ncbi:MAG TPA: metal ABC transporter permease, partial [Negativicutes bacterium]|nr:metal ABC transporter permease [Negativicutes bacterium]
MDFLHYDFMQRALAAGLITAVVCPLIGVFVVVRRQALIGDGL